MANNTFSRPAWPFGSKSGVNMETRQAPRLATTCTRALASIHEAGKLGLTCEGAGDVLEALAKLSRPQMVH
eukprot:1142062-Pelagomonas_calceolata.AAC.1